jgi:hypothetical protein
MTCVKCGKDIEGGKDVDGLYVRPGADRWVDDLTWLWLVGLALWTVFKWLFVR